MASKSTERIDELERSSGGQLRGIQFFHREATLILISLYLEKFPEALPMLFDRLNSVGEEIKANPSMLQKYPGLAEGFSDEFRFLRQYLEEDQQPQP